MAERKQEVVEAAGQEVTITNPDKVFFPDAEVTKLDLDRVGLLIVVPIGDERTVFAGRHHVEVAVIIKVGDSSAADDCIILKSR